MILNNTATRCCYENLNGSLQNKYFPQQKPTNCRIRIANRIFLDLQQPILANFPNDNEVLSD